MTTPADCPIVDQIDKQIHDDRRWHLDKRIPVAILVTLLFQTMGFVWVVAKMSAQIDTNTRDIARLTTLMEVQNATVSSNTTSVAVMTGALQHVNESLRRIETAVEKE